uniref:Ribosomal protein L34 n=1 Tax=Olisthodiscus luteus TaxID=83000 RepID=A0A7U0KSB6_OLILU|nr:ribosomal protein L34 [Olisthodiscus luteus]YP_010152824.1 ribosomal protein L34 [Olisthodiscus luteus]QQW50467.1 ribosomal protein L34 [Olisthodiscus luteus]QQW50485.1 ribosomal protein L34 [Olisthodiscus luteus]
MTKRTLGGTKLKAIRKSGFRARLKTKSGKKVLQARRAKKRKKLAIYTTQ